VTIPRWTPPVEPTFKEEKLLKRLKRHKKLFGFLREHRHEIFTEEFQAELEGMYRDSGAGKTPTAPALMCMVVLLQCYVNVSDAEAVEASVMDARWRLALDSLDVEEPVFSQGSLQRFRERLIAHDMDRRLLERTVEVARQTGGADWKKLPRALEVGIDSRPLHGAGRVEDTYNLLGHAARKIVECASKLAKLSPEALCRRARCPLFLASSIKAGLDVDWSDAEQKADAINQLIRQCDSLVGWIGNELPELASDDPLERYMTALAEFEQQNLERSNDGTVQIRRGVAPDRRVSVEDAEMRHGRKSKSKLFNGYKEHIAADLQTALILACAVTPANAPEHTAAEDLKADIDRQGFEIGALLIDRGYLSSAVVDQVEGAGGELVCKPWPVNNNASGLFSKADFHINLRDRTITCPGGQLAPFQLGKVVKFDPNTCDQCSLRERCTTRAKGQGRAVQIAQDEARQKRLRKLQSSKNGRQRLRGRAPIEHRLAHIASRKGPRARYIGTRKNLYDIRRASAVQNLETLHRNLAA
jgi:hypothetical protein